MFGLPVPEALEAAAESDLALGGCVVSEDPPNWQCPRQHRWRDPDDRAWNQRLRLVLEAHGYRDV